MNPVGENVTAIWQAAQADFRDASFRDKLMFPATVAGLAAHQVGMEALLFATGTNVLAATNDPLLVGAANGIASLAIETALTLGTNRGLVTFEGATQEIQHRYILPDPENTSTKKLIDGADKIGTAIAVGSAAVVLMDSIKNPNKPAEERRTTGLRAALGLGALNAVLGTAISGAVCLSEKIGTNEVSDGVQDVAHSQYTYESILAVVGARVIYAAHKHRTKRRAQMSANEVNTSVDTTVTDQD